ncbi:MAG: class I SAM-dependent methyltransferase [Gemmatimonadaceae bacterium]
MAVQRKVRGGLFVGHWLTRQLTHLGHTVGLCSRSAHNLEIWRSRGARSADGAAACPLCGADAEHQLRLPLRTSADVRELGDCHAVLCDACAVARTEPVPDDSARVITPDVQRESMSAMQRALLRRFIRQRVARVRPLLPTDRRPRVADVGGGACAFANALAATGCDVSVFEPNAANARFANSGAGVRFVAAPFHERAVVEAGFAEGTLDAITMWHALEHVPDPVATLALARRLLRPGGVLYVSVPNLDSLQADVGGTHWCYADIPRHLTHFSPEGLETRMQLAGFTAVTPYWWNAEYEIFGWYQTLLNLLTGSHNYFYNRAKKGRLAEAGPRPTWTRVATALGPILLPVVAATSWCASAASKPACVEMHGIAS